MKEMQQPMSDADRMQVWHDNQRDAQIGGVTDGVTPEVAADLGYHQPTPTTSDEVVDLAVGPAREIAAIEEKLDNGEPITAEEARSLNAAADDARGHGIKVDPSKPRTEVPGKHGRFNWQ